MVIEFSSFEFWGHIPHSPLPGGLHPLDPRLPTPVGLGFAGVLGPTRGGVAKVGNSPPLLNLWGHIPHSPLPGGLHPLDPRLPTLVGLGFAGVLAPTRGGVAKVDNPPPLLNFWGHIPQGPLPGGLRPLDPPFCPPP